jgi:hypothetical protein
MIKQKIRALDEKAAMHEVMYKSKKVNGNANLSDEVEAN